MSEETPESLIPYDEIVQEALREVVGKVLHEVEKSGGLPGAHHFYVTFKTRMPGVDAPHAAPVEEGSNVVSVDFTRNK